MNKKEKDAIEYLKRNSTEDDAVFWCYDAIPHFRIILNLIENQQNKIQTLEKQIKEMQEYYKNADFIFKDKIKERMEQTKKVYDEEMKPYMIEVENGEKVLNVTGLNKKEKEELINKRNCLLVQIKAYEMLLEENNE